MVVLCFNAVVTDSTVMAARRAPYATSATVFYGDFEVNLRWFWGLDEGPAIWRGNSEWVVVISFKWVDVAGVDLVGWLDGWDVI